MTRGVCINGIQYNVDGSITPGPQHDRPDYYNANESIFNDPQHVHQCYNTDGTTTYGSPQHHPCYNTYEPISSGSVLVHHHYHNTVDEPVFYNTDVSHVNSTVDHCEETMWPPEIPGFLFRPDDKELIGYLHQKLDNCLDFKKPFLDVNLYNYNPQDLIGMHQCLDKQQEDWYFFTPREKKSQNATRPQRSARDGYWKATALCTPVGSGDQIIGHKRVLDFYMGTHERGNRTEWKMHEYLTENQYQSLSSTTQNSKLLNDWVLCKIYKNRRSIKRKDHPEDETNREQPLNQMEEDFLQFDGNINFGN